MVYVSMSLRMKVDAEAMNMVEPSGSYIKHRTVPLIVRFSEGHYRIVNAPAVSGQHLAYAYQVALVKLASERGLKVCNACRNYSIIGGFIKYNGDIKSCVVEDLTGFMIPEREAPKRRTSVVSFSYMVPDPYSVAQIVPQMHVRYHFLDPNMQTVFEVENASAIYTVLIGFDVDRIGVVETGKIQNNQYVSVIDKVDDNERRERVKLAFDALVAMFDGMLYGAKKSRNKPFVEILGGIATISHPLPFEVSPARVRDPEKDHYIIETLERAKWFLKVLKSSKLEQKIIIKYFTQEGLKLCSGTEKCEEPGKEIKVVAAKNFEELVEKVRDTALELLGLPKS